MANNGKARPLAVIVGERLREFREEKGLRQADIASKALSCGLGWSRSSVAALESGTRNLSIEEVILIPYIIAKAGGWDKPLLPEGVKVLVAPAYHFITDDLARTMNALLVPVPDGWGQQAVPVAEDVSGKRAIEEDEEAFELGVESRDPRNVKLQEARMLAVTGTWRSFIRQFYPGADPARVLNTENRDNPELAMKVAARLNIVALPVPVESWDFVVYFSWGMWGRSIGKERDARAELRGEFDSKRSLQAARGHVTREMIGEINAEIKSREPELRETFAVLAPIWDDVEKLVKVWEGETKLYVDERLGGHPPRPAARQDDPKVARKIFRRK